MIFKRTITITLLGFILFCVQSVTPMTSSSSSAAAAAPASETSQQERIFEFTIKLNESDIFQALANITFTEKLLDAGLNANMTFGPKYDSKSLLHISLYGSNTNYIGIPLLLLRKGATITPIIIEEVENAPLLKDSAKARLIKTAVKGCSPTDGRPNVSLRTYLLLNRWSTQEKIEANHPYCSISPEDILDIQKKDSSVINKKYRELSLKWHPDRNADPIATEVFQLITWAYEKLIPK